MNTTGSRFGVAVVLALALAGCATTEPSVGAIPTEPIPNWTSPRGAIVLSMVSAMPTNGEPAPVPAGYVSFCVRFSDQCVDNPNLPQTVVATPELWQKLAKINADVNSAIWPEDDERHYGRAEFWTIPTDGYGDCEDYAVTKRKALIALGLSPAALRLAVVVAPDQNRHAVLTVATDMGDYVLDNLSADIVPWSAAGYTWVERQDATKPTGWVFLRSGGVMMADEMNPAATASADLRHH